MIKSYLLVVFALAGCASNVQYVKYNLPPNAPTANLMVWVDHYRNSDRITFGTFDPNDKGEKSTMYAIGELVSGSMFDKEVKEISFKLPANEVFPLYFRNISASGYVTKVCSGVVPLRLEFNKNYKIEFVNWKPKDAVFSNFTCELDIGEVMPDGSIKQIAYIEQNKK